MKVGFIFLLLTFFIFDKMFVGICEAYFRKWDLWKWKVFFFYFLMRMQRQLYKDTQRHMSKKTILKSLNVKDYIYKIQYQLWLTKFKIARLISKTFKPTKTIMIATMLKADIYTCSLSSIVLISHIFREMNKEPFWNIEM